MAERFYLTTAIDYPNSRPHIGTAFEKIGADVQARYRRMEGYDVFFLMGNDENTVKVARKAAELGRPPKDYCDDMARQFQEVWKALDISYDDFIQTSEPRHHAGCRRFIQKVYDNGHIYKGHYEGWYCEGCEEFKTETQIKEAGGVCPAHQTPPLRRREPCYFFALSKFQDQLLEFYQQHPEFMQPESRANEVLALVQSGLQDVNITRSGQDWGIRVPFDEAYTIYVWFDALLNYVTAIGYGSDEERFRTWWPADIHFIGKDITRFHCALWPAMLFAAGLEPPRTVFAHGFVYLKGDSGELQKMSKTLGNIVEPMDIITKFSGEAFRYYFLRECPFPGDGEFSWHRFAEVYNADLANNLGNLYSRVITLITKNYHGHLHETAGQQPGVIFTEVDTERTVEQVEEHIEKCQYNQALERIWRQVLDPANRYADQKAPWNLVKTDPEAAKHVLYDLAEQLRAVAILLKPFLPRTAETIYRSFNFPQPWEEVRFEDVWVHPRPVEDLRVVAPLEGGKVKPLFPRIT
ncbi:MAG: methionine--tRNA ligase [Gemmataceae bacterium]|nr:methionine--tRNA ligase [Gemmataceae bacterium]MDW8265396.1 methionine--tRNA ligase [Gemmataceae bacterium]